MKGKYLLFFVVLLLTLVVHTNARAQDIVDLKQQYEKGITLYNEEKYAEAIAQLEDVLPEVEKVYTDTASYINLINTLADAQLQNKATQKAKFYFHKAWAAYQKNRTVKYLESGIFSAVSLGNIYQSENKIDSVFYFYQQAIKEWDHCKGDWDNTYLDLYSSMVDAYPFAYKEKQVDSLYQNYSKRIEKVKGKSSVAYAETQIKLADRYMKREQFDQAAPLYAEGLKVLNDSALTTTPIYLEAKYNEGRICFKKNNYTEAESSFKQSWQNTTLTSDESRVHAYSALRLGDIAKHYKHYNEALLYLLPLLNYSSAMDDFNISLFALLANIYLEQGEWMQSEDYYNKALALNDKKPSPKIRLQLLSGLINLYESEGKTEKSALLLSEASALAEKNFGNQSEEYAHLLALHAAQQKLMAQWTAAEESYKKAISILEAKAKDRMEEWIFLYNNLAEVYQLLGREQEAEQFYNKASTMAASAWGSNSIDYAYTLTNLASLQEKKGKYEEALGNYNKALSIFEKVVGKNNVDYFSVMNNIAYVYVRKGNLPEAETRLTTLLPAAEKALGKEHVLVTTMLNNQGLIREKQERYKEASDFYFQSLTRRSKAHGAQHPLVTDVYCNLARSLAAQKNYKAADTCWFNALENFRAEINLYFPVMSEKEKSAFYYTIQDRFEQFNSYAVNHTTRSPKMLEYIFKYQTLTKSLLFRSGKKMHDLLKSNSNPSIQKAWKEWEMQRELLATLYTTGKLSKEKQDSLERQIETSEKELSKYIQMTNNSFKLEMYDWKDVQAKLGEGEVWIEVVRFRKYKPEKGGTYIKYKFIDDQIERDSVYYAFIIIDKENTVPQIVLVKNGTELENRYIKYYYNATIYKLEDEHTFKQFWSSVHHVVKENKRVYLSSDGVYHLLNVATIKDESGKYILDQYDIYSYTGASDLIEYKAPAADNKKVRLIGSPEFTEVKIGMVASIPMALPGTLLEVQLINDLFKQQNWKVTLSSGFNANEKALKEIESPYVLHVATHGFFLEDIEASKEQASQSENPLMRSGLILAKNTDRSDLFSDGVLSAYEAMNLPLAGTRLVVLSACQTGQGKVKNGEGVYGLQRSLRSSGAASIVLSLWKVDDKVTQELMVQFYKLWLNKPEADMKQAFFEAQRLMKEKYPQPYYWGAFTWVGN
ncbi:MAG: CHAT domain-containing protein [Cytophagaceae bacterium]|nr:CHAT domain-containing protein [Cytophagaceae bacterium]